MIWLERDEYLLYKSKKFLLLLFYFITLQTNSNFRYYEIHIFNNLELSN